jgi:hypothetical protein
VNKLSVKNTTAELKDVQVHEVLSLLVVKKRASVSPTGGSASKTPEGLRYPGKAISVDPYELLSRRILLLKTYASVTGFLCQRQLDCVSCPNILGSKSVISDGFLIQ